MGLTSVFCCLRTDSCLQGTEEEVIYMVYFSLSETLMIQMDQIGFYLPESSR